MKRFFPILAAAGALGVLLGTRPASALDHNKNGVLDPYEDPSLPIPERIDDLLGRMTPEEKTMQLVTLYGYCRVLEDPVPTEDWKNQLWIDGLGNIDEQANNSIRCVESGATRKYSFPWSNHVEAMNAIQRWFLEETRLGIPVDMTNEGIRGLCHDSATSFPCNLGLAATWNTDLVRQAGQVIGEEARALGYTNVYAPILDLARDPRWGRTVETYGESPFLVGSLGLEMTHGIQSTNVASTLKHFAVYGIPHGGRDGHTRTDPLVGPREMLHLHLEPFRRVIAEGGALGVMSSYNDWDGLPVSGSDFFLQYLLREKFGFEGYVVSDSDAVEFLSEKHRVSKDYKHAVVRALEAGVNIRTTFTPPSVFIEPLREALSEGLISESTIDARVRDVLRVKFRLGLFDDPFRDPEAVAEIVRDSEHVALGRQASAESMVLLKNDGLLPLDRSELKRVLVTGPLAADEMYPVSRYGPSNLEVVSVFEGVKAALGESVEVVHVKGADLVDERWPESEILPRPLTDAEQAAIDEAVAAAKKSDVAIVVLGDSERTVGESTSRTSLDLPGRQRDLLQAIHATGTPTVLVLMNGRPASINWADRHVPAILQAWFPNEKGGRVIAETLLGNLNPGGKLPVTFPKTVGQIPLAFPHKPAAHTGQDYYEPDERSRVSGYLYPFGHGLSYTTFAYEDLQVRPPAHGKIGPVQVAFTVTNTGERAGDEVAQVYFQDVVSSLTTYDLQLRGFERVHLDPGESKRLIFTLSPRDFSLINRAMERVVEPGAFRIHVGSSSTDLRLEDEFELGGEPVVLERYHF